MLHKGSKKYKQFSHIYGKPFRLISAPNAMHEYLNPKTAGGVNLTPPVIFRKMYLLKRE